MVIAMAVMVLAAAAGVLVGLGYKELARSRAEAAERRRERTSR
jgi:hypothetical protein